MTGSLTFSKYSGLGNDFIIFNCLDLSAHILEILSIPSNIQLLCNRNFGIGADGILLLNQKIDSNIYNVTIYNSDGSQAEMCGNGIRCIASYIIDNGLNSTHKTLKFDTLAGLISVDVLTNSSFAVNMGKPILEPKLIPTLFKVSTNNLPEGDLVIGGKHYQAYSVGMGNPHLIIPAKNLSDRDLLQYGRELENHSSFPNKTNVHFVEVINPRSLKLLIWERGAGPTLACGTGACASLVATSLLGLSENSAKVSLPGGDLYISWPSKESEVEMNGPAHFIYHGELRPESLPKLINNVPQLRYE